MEIESIQQFITLLAAAGVTGAGAGAIVVNLLMEKVKIGWTKQANLELEEFKRSANREIEGLKGDISKNNSIITTLLTQQGQAYQKILDKRIDAAQKVWDGIFKLKSLVPEPISFAYKVYTDDELEKNFLSKSTVWPSLCDDIKAIKIDEFAKSTKEISSDLIKIRPFISDKISVLLFVYEIFLGRSVFFLMDSQRKGNAKSWRKDKTLRDLLEPALETNELKYIFDEALVPAGSFHVVCSLLETKILNEINHILLGSKHTEDTIKQTEEWRQLLQTANTGGSTT